MSKKKEYQARQAGDLSGYDGGRMGIFAPGQLAEAILGQTDYGQIFAYLFRRFGFPRHGCDEAKEIVRYELTTPMEGVALSVSPRFATWHSFGYLLSGEVERACMEEDRAPLRQWQENLIAWARSLGVTLLNRWDDNDPAEVARLFSAWQAEHYPDTTEASAAMLDEFWEAQQRLWREFVERYQEVEPPPPMHEFPASSLCWQVNEALKAAIADLLRPVLVDDVLINICGRVEQQGKLKLVDPSPMAGFGVVTEVYDDSDTWFDFVDEVGRIGGGNFMAGLKQIQTLCKVQG